VLERTFDIGQAQKVIDENNLNVILTDSGYAYHINSKGIDKGSGFLEAVKMLDADINDTIAIGDSETDVPLFNMIKNTPTLKNLEV
jgi:hydroxymethylpyrimidine pyrophosphatase-like HAD family hydrolase